jgi:hypothetical protein
VLPIAVEKARSNACCECVFGALGIQHVKRMRCPAVPYFSTLSHKWYDFRGNVMEQKICIFIFSTTFVCNVSHLMKNSPRNYDESTQVLRYPLFLSDFNGVLILFRQILEI